MIPFDNDDDKNPCECARIDMGNNFTHFDHILNKRPQHLIYLAGKVYCGCDNAESKSPNGSKYLIPELCTKLKVTFTDSTSEGDCHGTWATSFGDLKNAHERQDWTTAVFGTIDQCCGMLVYLDQIGSSGSIAEMGYASGRGLPIYAYVRRVNGDCYQNAIEDEYRVALALPSVKCVEWVSNVQEVANHFMRHYSYGKQSKRKQSKHSAIQPCVNWLVVTGSTYDIRAELKALHGIWNDQQKAWFISADQEDEVNRLIDGRSNLQVTSSIDSPYAAKVTNFHLPTKEEFEAYDGGTASPAKVRETKANNPNWKCPCCHRTLFEVMRWTVINVRKSNECEGWLINLRGQFPWEGYTYSGNRGLICDHCSVISTRINQRFPEMKDFPYTMAFIQRVIKIKPHQGHEIDFDKVESERQMIASS